MKQSLFEYERIRSADGKPVKTKLTVGPALVWAITVIVLALTGHTLVSISPSLWEYVIKR